MKVLLIFNLFLPQILQSALFSYKISILIIPVIMLLSEFLLVII